MNKLTPSEVIDEWIKAKCELRGKCLLKTLYASYKAFTEASNYPPLSKHEMSYSLSSKSFKPYRWNGQAYRTRLALKDKANCA